MASTEIKSLEQVLIGDDKDQVLAKINSDSSWSIKMIKSEECLSYVVWNQKTLEAMVIDPKREDFPAYLDTYRSLKGYRFVAVVDTHTHADHISCAADLAKEVQAPLMMHAKTPCTRVHLRVCHTSVLPTAAGPCHLVLTPGHTVDSLCLHWGPFLFTGDTVLYGDVGRDDLPTGNPEDHFSSLETLRAFVKTQDLVCPGHDHKGGRISTWETQLKVNGSLTQPKESFVAESLAFDVPAPALFKKSLVENFK